jgi:hypothetical protein
MEIFLDQLSDYQLPDRTVRALEAGAAPKDGQNDA